MTKHEAAVISAYTGILVGEFFDMHEYAEKVLGRPVFTHQFATPDLVAELKAAAKTDFILICEAVE